MDAFSLGSWVDSIASARSVRTTSPSFTRAFGPCLQAPMHFSVVHMPPADEVATSSTFACVLPCFAQALPTQSERDGARDCDVCGRLSDSGCSCASSVVVASCRRSRGLSASSQESEELLDELSPLLLPFCFLIRAVGARLLRLVSAGGCAALRVCAVRRVCERLVRRRDGRKPPPLSTLRALAPIWL